MPLLGSLPCGYSQIVTGARVTSQTSPLKYLVPGAGRLEPLGTRTARAPHASQSLCGLSVWSPAQWLQLSCTSYMVAQGPKGVSPKNEPSRSYVIFSGLASEITSYYLCHIFVN